MIIILKQNADQSAVKDLCRELEGRGLSIHESRGAETHILGLVGDTKSIAESWLRASPVVEDVRRVSEPYKKANRKFHPEDTVVDVSGVKVGGGRFAVIAGPCSVESESQIGTVAASVQAAGAKLLRGGAFKPRTSPYSFQGMRAEGLELLRYEEDHELWKEAEEGMKRLGYGIQIITEGERLEGKVEKGMWEQEISMKSYDPEDFLRKAAAIQEGTGNGGSVSEGSQP